MARGARWVNYHTPRAPGAGIICGRALKKIMKPALKRRPVDRLDKACRVDLRRARRVPGFSRTSHYFRSIKVDDPALRQRIREVAQTRIRYGYLRIRHRPEVERLDQCWPMDFVADNLFNGRRIRALTVVDNFSRQCLAIHVDHSVKAGQVVSTMAGLRLVAGMVPQGIQVYNGTEFVSFRDECLNAHWFLSLDDARRKIEQWRGDYNCYRPYPLILGDLNGQAIFRHHSSHRYTF